MQLPFVYEQSISYFNNEGVRLTSEGGIFLIPRDFNVSALIYVRAMS